MPAIPWSINPCPEVYVEACGVTMRAYHGDPAVQLDVLLRGPELFHARFGLPLRTSVSPDFTTYLTGSVFGLTFEVFEDGVPSPPGHPLGSAEEAAGLQVPANLLEAGYFPEVVRFYEYFKAHAPAGMPVGFPCGTQAPLTTAVLLRGQGFLLDLVDRPDLAHRLLQTLTASAIAQRELARAMNGEEGVPGAIGFTDDYGGLLSPEHFTEFDLPYLLEIAEHFGAARKTIHAELLHQPHLAILQEAGFSYIDVGTDPHLDIARCAAALRVPFRVDFDNCGVMLLGTPEQVRALYRQMVEEGARETHVDLCRGTPEANVEAFLEVAREYA